MVWQTKECNKTSHHYFDNIMLVHNASCIIKKMFDELRFTVRRLYRKLQSFKNFKKIVQAAHDVL